MRHWQITIDLGVKLNFPATCSGGILARVKKLSAMKIVGQGIEIMERKQSSNSGPIRELEWLAYFFVEHGKNEIAGQIFEEVKRMRSKLKDIRFGTGHPDKRSVSGLEEQEN